MKIKVRAGQDTDMKDVKRLVDSLTAATEEHDLHSFTVVHPYNCAVLKLAPLSTTEVLTAQHVLVAATASLYALSVEDDHRGWLFMLPAQGNMFAVSSGVVYTKPDLMRLKGDYLKRVKVVNGEIKALDPEVYLPHSEFNILGIDQGSVLFIARNSTHVVTQ